MRRSSQAARRAWNAPEHMPSSSTGCGKTAHEFIDAGGEVAIALGSE